MRTLLREIIIELFCGFCFYYCIIVNRIIEARCSSLIKSNTNSLIPHQNIGKLGFGAPYKGVMCNMKRVRSLDED